MIDYEYRAGRVAVGPELRYTPGGTPVVNMTLIQSTRYFDRDSNEWKESARSVVDVVLWDKQRRDQDPVPWTKWTNDHLKVGDLVVVHGRLTQRRWQTNNGDNRYKTEFVADSVFTALSNLEPDSGGGVGAGEPEPPF